MSNLHYAVMKRPVKSFFNLNPALVGFETKGVLLGVDESHPMVGGGKDKFRRKTSSCLGRNGDVARADPTMCQPRVKCADWEI